MTVEIISRSISTKVWYLAGIELATPGSAVRHASVARHVTDWLQMRVWLHVKMCRLICVFVYHMFPLWRQCSKWLFISCQIFYFLIECLMDIDTIRMGLPIVYYYCLYSFQFTLALLYVVFLAHLYHRLKVSYCDHRMCALVCCVLAHLYKRPKVRYCDHRMCYLVYCVLAHLYHRLKVRYCDHRMCSLVCCVFSSPVP